MFRDLYLEPYSIHKIFVNDNNNDNNIQSDIELLPFRNIDVTTISSILQ